MFEVFCETICSVRWAWPAVTESQSVIPCSVAITALIRPYRGLQGPVKTGALSCEPR